MAACTASQSGGETWVTDSFAVGTEELTVLIADEPGERGQGLSGVTEIPMGADGMLFVFEDSATRTFWMKDTLIPLDIWWFTSSGELIGRTQMEPCEADPCTQYPSPGLVQWALETPAGAFDFQSGDRLSNVESE